MNEYKKSAQKTTNRTFFLFVILFLLFIIPTSVNAKTLIINSEEWQDVYSSMHYANLRSDIGSVYFFAGTNYAELISNLLTPGEEILLIESSTKPYYKDYENYLKIKGFSNIEVKYVKDIYQTNLDLGSEIRTNKFVVIDDEYGYNAVSVAPYAYITNSWVIFANRDNVGDIVSFLDDKDAQEVLLFGHLNREVVDALQKYSPEIIDNKNRFVDNVRISEKFLKIKPETGTAMATTGDFIETELMSGGDGRSPVLFIGKDNIYPESYKFLDRNNIRLVEIVGNDLIPAGQRLRDLTNKKISVIVKFGQGFTNLPGKSGQVYSLTVFPLPKFTFFLNIDAISYDSNQKALFVKYRNSGNSPLYGLSNIHIRADDQEVAIVSDKDAFFVEDGEVSVVKYDVDLTEHLSKELSADFWTLYGESPEFMERYILESGKTDPPYSLPITLENFENNAELRLDSVVYKKNWKRFSVKVTNIGQVDAYSNARINDILIDGVETTIYTQGVSKIPAGDSKNLLIKADLTESDILDNPTLKVTVQYGQDEELLTKELEQEFEFKVSSSTMIYVGIVIGIVILAAIAGLFVWKKKRYY